MFEPKQIFISHGAENKAFAQALATSMSKRGAKVWLDLGVHIGDGWPDAILPQLETASALVLLIPPATGTDRNHVWFEAGAARALGKRIIAVLPPLNQSANLPGEIADVLVLDADRHPLDSIVDTIIQAVPEPEALFS